MPMPAMSNGGTSERNGPAASWPGPNAKRPFSNSSKRKASDMEEPEDIYNATHIRSQIKQEPGLPNATRTSLGDELSIDNTLQQRDSYNYHEIDGTSRPSYRLGDTLPVFEDGFESSDYDSREASEVEDEKGSSNLSTVNMWDVGKSDLHTSETEQDSSDEENDGSAFSLGMERQMIGEPDRSSRNPNHLSGKESANMTGVSGPADDRSGVSCKSPHEVTANDSNRTERDTRTRSTLEDQIGHTRDESSETPHNEPTRRNNETTAKGGRRQRAPPKTHICARDISRSWKTANPADKMLVKMKERGCDWLEIRKAWQELTGEWPAPSTLPNRYNRVKDNLTRLKPGDVRVSLIHLYCLSLRNINSTCPDIGSFLQYLRSVSLNQMRASTFIRLSSKTLGKCPM